MMEKKFNPNDAEVIIDGKTIEPLISLEHDKPTHFCSKCGLKTHPNLDDLLGNAITVNFPEAPDLNGEYCAVCWIRDIVKPNCGVFVKIQEPNNDVKL